jgi:sulfatase maturation enzyme AslB (radical SAM superfamily)
MERLRALAEGRDIAPVTVEIDPVAWCNHACGWCVDPVHVKQSMPFSLFERLIEELAEFNVEGQRVGGVVFKGGGEPSLHPRFAQMVARAADLGFGVGVVTNGSRLESCRDSLAAHAAYVRVSVDGPTPESHRHIHGSRDFERILRGVSGLVAARGERRHPVIGMSFALDIHSIHLADEAIGLGERLGADYVLLRPPFYEEVGREPTMTIAEARAVRSELIRRAAEYQGPVDLMIGQWISDAEQSTELPATLAASGRRDNRAEADLPIEHRTHRCLASPLLAVITADGTLYGCCNLRALPQWSMGRLDYGTGVGLRQLWRGERRRDVLDRMHRTDCIGHCTHPLSRYNEIVEVLRHPERWHSEFV